MRRTSTSRRSRRPGNTGERPIADVFHMAYQGMSRQDQDVFWGNLLEDGELRGELLDTILLAERRGGPYHPEYEAHLKEIAEERGAQKAKHPR